MPDRYGESPDEPLPESPAAQTILRAQAVANCGLCDDDGYRGSTVCDHVDHAAAAKRGMDMIRAVKGWSK